MPPRIDIDQISMVRSVAAGLVGLPLDDVNLLLYNGNVEEVSTEDWHGDWNGRYSPDDDDRRRVVVQHIRHLDKADLVAMSTAMHVLFNTDEMRPETTQLQEPTPLQLFASHLTTQRQFVHQVADSLRRWHISLFVAHDDIAPDEAWHDTIEASLKTVDGGVVFMYPKFIESQWCDQEVGWLLGRGVPIRTLMFNNQNPYGPVGKRQAMKVSDSATADAVADGLVEWAAGRLEFRSQFNSSLVHALASSTSFAQTDRIWAQLAGAEDLTDAQVATVTAAVRDNNQVFGASCRVQGPDFGSWFPEVIIPFLIRQPGYEANADLIAGAAEARSLGRLLPAGSQPPAVPVNDAPF